jgi:hypothetical protein
MPSATASPQTVTGTFDSPKKRQRKSKTAKTAGAAQASAASSSHKGASAPTLVTSVQAAPMTVAAYVTQPATVEHSKHMSNLLTPFARPTIQTSTPDASETPPTQGVKTGGEAAVGDSQLESVSSSPSSFASSLPSQLPSQFLSPPPLSPLSSQANSQLPQPSSPKPPSPAPVRHDHTRLLPPPTLAPPSVEPANVDDIAALGMFIDFLFFFIYSR